MTGYGEAHIQEGGLDVVVELRSINSRYMKLALRCPDGYGSLEGRIDACVRQLVRRGTLQVNLRVHRVANPDDYRINQAVLNGYVQQLRHGPLRLSPEDSLPWQALLLLPGVIDQRSIDESEVEAEWPVIGRAVESALESLQRMRRAEGRAMADDLLENCRLIGEHVHTVDRLAPQVVAAYHQRLTERLGKLLTVHEVTAQPADVVREVGLFAERADISEELVRLRSHIEQFQAGVQSAESSGRKLEFLIQEMFREANTIGSKANDAQIAQHVVDIKTAIERMREMIQNVE